MEPETEHFCGPCRRKEYAFDLARSYGLYARTLRAAILELKFHRRERWAGTLGGLLAQVWPSIARGIEGATPVLVPVPLHRSRQRERGFNQAELLARGLRRKLARSAGAVPAFDTRCLRRVRATLPQSGLGHRARVENVQHVFSAKQERVRGRNIVLVDDVMTTGATASACALTLKRAGASKVITLTLARATPQFPDGVVPLDPRGDRVDGLSSAQT
jgi:ComF family protein